MAFQKRGLSSENMNGVAGGGVKYGCIYRKPDGTLYADTVHKPYGNSYVVADGYLVYDNKTGKLLNFAYNEADAYRKDRKHNGDALYE